MLAARVEQKNKQTRFEKNVCTTTLTKKAPYKPYALTCTYGSKRGARGNPRSYRDRTRARTPGAEE